MSLRGFLVLEDKKVFKGQWMAKYQTPAVGEVVFNTSMQGYQEIVTDPSYFGQIVVSTTPEQGNYGVADSERESSKVFAEGFICQELNASWTPGRKQFKDELEEFSRGILSDVDTRGLTLHLRSYGTIWGCMIAAESETLAVQKALPLISERKKNAPQDWVYEVTTKKTINHQGQGTKGRVAVIDCGVKSQIVEELKLRFKDVAQFGSRTSAQDILKWEPNGVVVTNGPGDPDQVQTSVLEIKKLLGQVPLFGICMGHQLLALALGGKTFKLKFGHRGGNHPVKNLATNEIYMTSQNHGYAVDQDLPSGVSLSQINLYDKTVEGIEMASKKAWSVQYHPEAGPGPHDSRKLFDYFKEMTIK